MEKSISRGQNLWISVNVVLFSGYAFFGVASLFWPTSLEIMWFIPLYLVSIAAYIMVMYGLIKKKFYANYLAAFLSPLMIAHLIVFSFAPLGMELAYMGPSRSFYSFFLFFLSHFFEERHLFYTLIGFNIVSMVIHSVNLFYFTRRKTAQLFMREAFIES